MENICKDKSKLNLSIDIIMLLFLLPVAGIGFLIKYVLVPGIQRNSIYGNNVDLEFWGLSRHQWGTVHLILSIVFLFLLILHILLHWRFITCVFKKLVPHKTLRIIITGALTLMGFLCIAFPLLVKPEVIQREPLHQNRAAGITHSSEKEMHNSRNNITSNENVIDDLKEKYDINGSMTLEYVARKYNVPINIIAKCIKIPENMSGEKLGRLKKLYAFTMDDIRECIEKYKRTQK
jgi:hypothetical protein